MCEPPIGTCIYPAEPDRLSHCLATQYQQFWVFVQLLQGECPDLMMGTCRFKTLIPAIHPRNYWAGFRRCECEDAAYQHVIDSRQSTKHHNNNSSAEKRMTCQWPWNYVTNCTDIACSCVPANKWGEWMRSEDQVLFPTGPGSETQWLW